MPRGFEPAGAYQQGLGATNTIIIGEVLTIEGVDRHDITGAHLYEGRAVPVGTPGDTVVVKDVPDEADFESYLEYMDEVGLGATEYVSLNDTDVDDVPKYLYDNKKVLEAVSDYVEGDTALISYNFNSAYATPLANRLAEMAGNDVRYLGSDRDVSKRYNDKVRFNQLVQGIQGIAAEPGVVYAREEATVTELREAWERFNIDGQAMVKPNKGASGVNMYTLRSDNIREVLGEMRDAKDDVTQWRISPLFPLQRSNSGLYRVREEGVDLISPVSGQILYPTESDLQPGTVHHGNYYPAGYHGDGLTKQGRDEVHNQLLRIGNVQHGEGARAFGAGVDFIQLSRDVPKYGLDEHTIIPVENNWRLTGQDPAASMHSKLHTAHDIDRLFLVLYNTYPDQETVGGVHDAIGDLLYSGDEPYGTVVTNPFPLQELGKTTFVSFATAPQRVRKIIQAVTERVGDDKTFEVVEKQVPWM